VLSAETRNWSAFKKKLSNDVTTQLTTLTIFNIVFQVFNCNPNGYAYRTIRLDNSMRSVKSPTAEFPDAGRRHLVIPRYLTARETSQNQTPLITAISPNSTWLVTSLLDTTRHVRRVEPVKLVVSSVSSRAVRQARHGQNAWARHVECVEH